MGEQHSTGTDFASDRCVRSAGAPSSELIERLYMQVVESARGFAWELAARRTAAAGLWRDRGNPGGGAQDDGYRDRPDWRDIAADRGELAAARTAKKACGGHDRRAQGEDIGPFRSIAQREDCRRRDHHRHTISRDEYARHRLSHHGEATPRAAAH